jgi:aryl-alcohol dehydrogenase-like predicted oxidoreductase
MGCWAIAGDWTWGAQDEKDAIEAIHAALDEGINFFDTAEGYGEQGESEVLLGKALASRRGQALIATKVSQGHLEPAQLRTACEASLKRLGTDHIDLYQVHWPSRNVPLSETLNALNQLKKEGKIRAIGVSNFGAGDLRDLLKHQHVESNQLPYSLLWRAIEFQIQPVCQTSGIGILCYSPLAQGLLTGKFQKADDVPDSRARTKHFSSRRSGTRHGQSGQEEITFNALREIQDLARASGHDMAALALTWLIHQPAVTSVLAGARNAAQVRQNARAGSLKPTDDVLRELTRITTPLKAAFGPDPDMWAKESRYR